MDKNETKKIKMGSSWWRLWIKMKKNLNGFVPVVGVGKKQKKGIWGGGGGGTREPCQCQQTKA